MKSSKNLQQQRQPLAPTMTTKQYIKLGKRTSLYSFLIGTGIFGLYFLTSSFELLFVGYGFIVVTGIVNIGILISILVKAYKDICNRKKLITTSGIMLLNIPVMIIYCWIAILLTNIMRITFTNSTNKTLTNINVVGCGGGKISELKVGQSETVWVDINGDCSISVEYLSNGQHKNETVIGYVTTLMGQKMKYNIGGQNEDQY